MSLSETIATAEGRIQEAVVTGRTRLRAVVGTAEERVEATLPRLREQLDVLRERSFEDAQRIGGYVTEGLTWLGGRLPKIELPFAEQVPSPEELAGSWFDTTGRALELQRKLTLEWIAALRQNPAAVSKAKANRPAKEARSAA